MLGSLALLFGSVWQQAAPGGTPVDLFAMTRSGVQVEVRERPVKGALDLVTPFGIYHTPTDPVETTLERARDHAWRGQLRTQPELSLVPTIEMYHDNGQISALLELSEVVIARGRPEELHAALTALEVWGARFDPVPDSIDSDERDEWLWEQVEEMEGPRRLLFGARLAAEVTPAGNGVGDRQLTLTTLRRALEDGRPLLQRVALLVARRQLMDEPYFGALIQHQTLYGSREIEDLAGATAVRLRPIAAREYWVKALLRADDGLRPLAARQLARHLPDDAPKAFAVLLEVGDRLAPARFRSGDRTIHVVVDRLDPLSLGMLQSAFSRGGSERNEYLENASAVKVIRMDEALSRLLPRLLESIAADDQERTREQWLEWCRARQAKP